ncbi:MAG: hypothetical protein HY454_03595 [Parcubacteria group bacterium]|nr:hypothetical protein [Parcubacteria group bacterium]
MFFVLIPLSLLLVSLGVSGRIIYRKIPRDLENWNAQLAQEDFGPTFYQKYWATLAQESKKFFINTSTKTVHRLKIVTLKTDNFFGKLLLEMRHRRQRIHEDAVNKTVQENVPLPSNTGEADVSAISPKVGLASWKAAKIADDGEVDKMKPIIAVVPRPVSAFAAREQQYISQLAYNPKDVAVYKRLGWLYLENAKPFQARQAFKMAVKLGSKDKNVITKLLEMGGVVHKEGSAASVEMLSSEGDNTPETKRLVSARVKTRELRRIKVSKG